MAGNANSGNGIAFRLSQKEFDTKINLYQAEVLSGDRLHPCPSDWYVYLGYSVADMRELMEYRDKPASAYYIRARAAKKMLDWVKNQVQTNPNWHGTKTAILAKDILRQDWGDGESFRDDKDKAAAPTKINIQFGGGDKRSKEAWK